jgi:hypothetical protein
MPSLFRFLIVVAVLCGIGYGIVLSLARFVEPRPREIVVTIPPSELMKHR